MCSTAVQAASVTFSGSVVSQPLNWNQTVQISQFDPSLGTLTGIDIALDASVTGDASVESLDSAMRTLTATFSAEVTASQSSLGQLLSANPTASASQTLTAFDGAIDFGGTSGFVTGTLMDSVQDTAMLNSGLAPFVGLGTVGIDLDASGSAVVTGSNNTASITSISSGATLSVTYTYDEAGIVPLPAGFPLLIAGLGGLTLVRRRSAGPARHP